MYFALSKEIRTLKNQQKLEENVAFNLNRGLKWLSFLIVFGIIVAQFGFAVSLIIFSVIRWLKNQAII